jgi:hypothetical protein
MGVGMGVGRGVAAIGVGTIQIPIACEVNGKVYNRTFNLTY